jgi:hypothetical protein
VGWLKKSCSNSSLKIGEPLWGAGNHLDLEVWLVNALSAWRGISFAKIRGSCRVQRPGFGLHVRYFDFQRRPVTMQDLAGPIAPWRQWIRQPKLGSWTRYADEMIEYPSACRPTAFQVPVLDRESPKSSPDAEQ